MESWRPVFTWARRYSVGPILALIVDAGFLARFTAANIIHFLDFFRHSRSRSLLESWRFEDPVAQELFRLLQALDEDDSVIKALPPPSNNQAKYQIRGHSQILYLLALVIAKPPADLSDHELEAFHTLKLWTLIQLLRQAADGIYQEAYLVELATRIRQSEDPTHKFASTAVRKILPQTDAISAIRYLLGQRAAKALLSLEKETSKETAESRFLRTVIKLSAGETGKKGPGPNQAGQPTLWERLGGDLSGFESRHAPPLLPEFPDDDEQPVVLPVDEEEDLLVFDFGDLRASLAEQRQEEADLLAANVEHQLALPYSWHNLNPGEEAAMDDWIQTALNAPELPHQLLGVFVWIALETGRSLRDVRSLAITTDTGIDWTWDKAAGCLHRLPPKRRNGWEPGSAHRAWIVPTATRELLPLPEPIQAILFEARQTQTDVATLGDLWGHSVELPERLFRKQIDVKRLGRIRQGMLANRLYLRSYQATGNALLARLVSAHSQTGLPGACAYPSFLASDLLAPFSVSDDDEIALGSRLDPLDEGLHQSIAAALRMVTQPHAKTDLIEYHNRLVAYLRQAILVTTGIRPVRDILDSPRRIDAEQHFLFVDDKGSKVAHQGRLVPLPESLSRFLLKDYARHLKHLAEALEAVAPKMAKEVARLSRGEPSQRMPYLFLLNVQDDALSWVLPSSEAVAEIGLFDWPLPDNLFRHRLVDRLRRRGIDQEIIDAVMGHLTNNTATYGRYSRRCWQDDQRQLRPAIEAAFSHLGFRLPKIGRTLPALKDAVLSEKPLVDQSLGVQARRKARRKARQRAFLAANVTIDKFLAGRDLTELDETELQTLAQTLCFFNDGRPRPNGLQRHAHFIRKLEVAWQKKGKRIQTGRKAFRGGYREKSLFLPEAVNAQTLYAQLLQAAEGLADKVLASSRAKNRDAALLTALSLCLAHRVTNPRLLLSILAGRDTRLVIHKRCAWLEYAPELPRAFLRGPVQRLPLQAATARLLELSFGQKQPYPPDRKAPTWLKGITRPLQRAGHLGKQVTLRNLLTTLARLVDQVNLQTLPACHAAVLSGNLATYSLCWDDRLRLELGHPLTIRYNEAPDVSSRELGDLPSVYGATLPPDIASARLQENAKRLLDSLRKAIPLGTEESTYATREARKPLARHMIGVLQPDADQVSSAIVLLAQWTVHLLFQKAHGKRHCLRLSSVRRYLASFSKVFIQFGYAMDLANAEPEQVTDFYRRILSTGKRREQAYRAKRLPVFHAWARGEGIAEPEWGELPKLPAVVEVAPGLITETEYLEIFQRLQNQTGVPHRLMDVQGFIWLCAYRYGLREHEAFYLRASDRLPGEQGRPILLVRNNRLRRLKTDPSRRQVPCLDALSSRELELFERVLPADGQYHDWETASYIIEEDRREQRWRVRAGILAAIKAVTGNPDLGIHHARHSVANQVGIALHQASLPDDWKAFQKDDAWQQAARITLLGRDEVSRRSSWGGCRFLGHSTPRSTFENYWHFLLDEIGEHLAIDNRVSSKELWRHAIVLDERITPIEPEPQPPVEWTFRSATPHRLILLCQQLACGRTVAQAARILRLDPARCHPLDHLAGSLGRKMLRGVRKRYQEQERWTPPANPHEGFLQHITYGGWRRLLALCKAHPKSSAARNPELDEEMLNKMIGASRHLLMWEVPHFSVVRKFLDHYGLKETLYQVVMRSGAGEEIQKAAIGAGFSPVDQKRAASEKRGTAVQIDTLRLGNDRGGLDDDRCALIVRRNSEHPVHNGYELAVLFLIWVLGEGGND